jgi:hypothetical protein
MNPRKYSRRRFWKDLTRTRHMTAVSAVVLGTTFMPLLGVPDIHELRSFQGVVEGFSDARAEVLAPRRNDEAARERIARTISRERNDRDRGGADAGADRLLTVERPEHQTSGMLDTANILPLPPVDEPELAMPAEEDLDVPELVEEEKPEGRPADDEMLEEEELEAIEEDEEV